MNKVIYLIVFLVINFGGLALGSWLMNGGPTSEWYRSLNKAPWTPPGWVFGVAWSTIMLCFSWYLAELFKRKSSLSNWLFYAIQVVLNVSWNWIFFNQQQIVFGFVVIVMLTLVIITYYLRFNQERLKFMRYLLLPYILWLCIATSLNGYIVFNN